MLLFKTPLLVLVIFIFSRNKNFRKNESFKGAEKDAQKSFQPLGIANLGHTCFMNSVLQSLYSASLYRNQVLMQSYKDKSVGDELKRLFQSMQDVNFWFVNPTKLAKALGINVRIQQDAEELLLDLVNRVDGSTVLSGEQKLPSAIMRFESYQCIDCLNVNFTKHKIQRNMDLSVDINGHSSLQDAVRAHFKAEYLTGDNQYQTKEFGLQDAKRSVSLYKPDAMVDAETKRQDKQLPVLPEVLVLHLKRFAFNPATSDMHKVGDPVDIPLTLNLSGLSIAEGGDTHTSTGSSNSHRVTLLPQVSNTMNSSSGGSNSKDNTKEELRSRVEAIANGLPAHTGADGAATTQEQKTEPEAGAPGQVASTAGSGDEYDEYTLSSIVIHKGTLNSGHYYALCRVPVREPDSEAEQKPGIINTCSARKGDQNDTDRGENSCVGRPKYKWLKFNDHVVTEISEAEALAKARGREIPGAAGASKGAYLVFYTRNH